MKSRILFVIFLISAAAMDSEHTIFVGSICLISISLLYLEIRKEERKKKGPAETGPVIKNIYNCILVQGKEKCNGKMQNLRRKLRQRGADRRCLSGMPGRREIKTDDGRQESKSNEQPLLSDGTGGSLNGR